MLTGGDLVAFVACLAAESVKAYLAVLEARYALPSSRSQLAY